MFSDTRHDGALRLILRPGRAAFAFITPRGRKLHPAACPAIAAKHRPEAHPPCLAWLRPPGLVCAGLRRLGAAALLALWLFVSGVCRASGRAGGLRGHALNESERRPRARLHARRQACDRRRTGPSTSTSTAPCRRAQHLIEALLDRERGVNGIAVDPTSHRPITSTSLHLQEARHLRGEHFARTGQPGPALRCETTTSSIRPAKLLSTISRRQAEATTPATSGLVRTATSTSASVTDIATMPGTVAAPPTTTPRPHVLPERFSA